MARGGGSGRFFLSKKKKYHFRKGENMNADDLQRLKEWRERGGMTEGEYKRWIAENTTLESAGIAGNEAHLWEMRTNLALALHDFLMILGVGDDDIAEVLGPENIEYIDRLLSERPIPLMDEGAKAFRSAKTLFEPEKGLEEYGLMATIIRLPDAVWDALEENEDSRFVCLGPLVLDQNTKTIWMWNGLELESFTGPMKLDAEQREVAVCAMRTAGGGLLEISFP